ncbi:MAG: TolC family protein [Acidobacteriia bacterium]|nr:TolC family protein [Terriglobia bacterium]
MRRVLFTLALGCLAAFAQPPGKVITLEEAVREALANNLDLAAEKFNISTAEARQITASLRPNPVLTVSGNHLDLLGTGYTAANSAGPNEVFAHTDFLLERGRKREARMEVALAQKSFAELAFRDSMRRLILDVDNAFVDLQASKEVLKLAQDNYRTISSLAAINANRVASGDLAAVELKRSQVAALQIQTTVRQAELAVRQARSRLQLVLGRTSPMDDFDAAGDLRSDAAPGNQLAIAERARLQRPDLLAAKQAIERGRAGVRLEQAQGKMDYTVGTEYVHQQAAGGKGNSLGFTFSTPLPFFNRNQGEILRAQREVEQASLVTRSLEMKITAEVADAWQRYSVAKSLLEDIERNMLPRAREVRDTTEYSYRRGEASLIEFLDAQRAFNEAVQSYNDARVNYARSLFLLDAAAADTGAGAVQTK